MKTKSFFQLLVLAVILFFGCNDNTEFDNNPAPTDETVKDIDGNTYKTVTIGKQTWMLDNLRVTKYRNGDPIATTIPRSLNIASESEPRYFWAYPEGFAVYECTYYTWYAIADERQITPEGWHVPSKDEWKILFENIENDTTVFKHVANGYRCHLGKLLNPSFEDTYYATSIEYDEKQNYIRCLKIDNSELTLYLTDKDFGLPVLCVKD